MLEAADLVAFVATTDPAAARAFYQDILGLPLIADDGFALVFDANGTRLRVVRVERFDPQPFTTVGWTVPDIRLAVAALTARAVVFERYPGMEQDELGIWHPPGGYVAWFRDPSGNVLSLSQEEE